MGVEVSSRSASLKYFSIMFRDFWYTSSFSWFCNCSILSRPPISSNQSTQGFPPVGPDPTPTLKIFVNESSTTWIVFASGMLNKSINGFIHPIEIIYCNCSFLPPEVKLKTLQAASFFVREQPFWRQYSRDGNIFESITVWIWLWFPAVILDKVQQVSLRTVSDPLASKWLNADRAPQSKTCYAQRYTRIQLIYTMIKYTRYKVNVVVRKAWVARICPYADLLG